MELVDLKIIDINTAIAKVTINPANTLGIEAGVIKKGSAADLCIFRRKEWLFNDKQILSSGKNNPFIGKTFNTQVEKTICHGKIVYEKR